jgi:hypothetical protein
MVFHEAHARWSLMANEPHADIEGVFFRAHSDARSTSGQKQKDTERPVMRVRLSRKRRQVDIARVVRSGRAPGEWITKTLSLVLSEKGWTVDRRASSVSHEEECGLGETFAFLRMCERTEDEEGRCSLLS